MKFRNALADMMDSALAGTFIVLCLVAAVVIYILLPLAAVVALVAATVWLIQRVI